MSLLPFRFSLIGDMMRQVFSDQLTNRRTSWDFSPKGPAPTAGLSARLLDPVEVRRKAQSDLC